MNETYLDLTKKKMKMDRFFTLYLDKFEKQMKEEDYDSDIWKLYHKKYKEYMKLKDKITVAQYRMSKPKHETI
jgi:hypothetical protein